MKKIFKYDIPNCFEFSVKIPQDHIVVHVNTQKGKPKLWVELDPMREFVEYKFRVYVTGDEIPTEDRDNYFYVGTFLLHDGEEVYHLYEQDYTSASYNVGGKV